MDLLLMLASLGLGIREEYRAQNGIVTKEQQRSLNMSAELARKNAERQRQHQEERNKLSEEIAKQAKEIQQNGRWNG